MTIPTNVTPRLWSFGNPVQAIVNYYKGRMTREDDQGEEVKQRSTKGAKAYGRKVPFVWGETVIRLQEGLYIISPKMSSQKCFGEIS